jgi:hypothetical protein
VSSEEERRNVTRRAVLIALVAFAALETGAMVSFAIAAGHREGILRTPDLLGWVLASGVIVVQTALVWAVVGRHQAARVPRRAVLCLIVALAVGLPAFRATTDEGFHLADAIFLASVNLAGMSLAILLATGIGRIYLWLASRRSLGQPG